MTEGVEKVTLKAQVIYIELIIERLEMLKAFPDLKNHDAIVNLLRDVNQIGGVKR